MFSLRSAAADNAWMPISNVPPSPAQAQTVVFVSPFRSSAARTPDAAAAADANGVCISGTPAALYGAGPSITDQQHAGTTSTVARPSALSARRIDSVAPHPAQPRWPGDITSSDGIA